MSLTPEHEQEFRLSMQAVQAGLISSDCLLRSVKLWLNDPSSSLSAIVMSQSGLSDQSLDTLQRMFASSRQTSQPEAAGSARQATTQAEDRRLNDRQIDLVHQLLNTRSDEAPTEDSDATIAYVEPAGAIDPQVLDRLIAEARRSELKRFRVEDELGKGGLGVVYQGTDLQLNRHVAIKKIGPRRIDSSLAREKFYLEAEITGQLEHPGIVPIYALGTDSQEEPYYAMRLIRGRDLLAVIHEFHNTLARQPGGFDSLEFRGLLQRFIDVCNAMEYAHSRRVLHRDLKPANIMIGKHGETLVVDWGLAKVMSPGAPGTTDQGEDSEADNIHVRSATDLTIPGTFAGTTRYAAPEQLAGRIDQLDARTDVYSLGAVLYELLGGQPPLPASIGPEEARARIVDGHVPSVQSLLPTVPKPLNAICRRAMMAATNQRYQSARELAEEVERWLADARVMAYLDEPVGERIGRWLRHHRSWTMSIAASLVLVSIVTILAALLINRARVNEQVARQNAQEFKADAIERYRVAKSAIDTLVERADKLRDIPGTEDIQLSILQEAFTKFAALSEGESLDPELEIERVRSLVRLADVQQLQDRSGSLTATYQTAIEQLRQPLGEQATSPPLNPTNLQIKRAIELGRAIARQGLAQSNIGQVDEARRSYESAIAVYQAWSKVDPANAIMAGNWAIAEANLGQLMLDTGKAESALAHLQQSLTLFEEAMGIGDPFMQPLFALAEIGAREMLGRTLRTLGKHVASRQTFLQAIQACDQFLNTEPTNLGYRERRLTLLISIAQSNRTHGDWRLAFENLRQARLGIDQLCQEFPDSLTFNTLQATIALNQGLVLLDLEQFDTATDQLKQALELLHDLSSSYPVARTGLLRADALNALGRLLTKRSSPEASALDYLSGAVETSEPLGTSRDPTAVDWTLELRRARYRSHLAQHWDASDQPDKARAEFALAIAVLTKCIDEKTSVLPAKSDLAHTLWHSGQFELACGQAEEARRQIQQAIALWQELVEKDYTPMHQFYLATCLADCPDSQLRDLPEAKRLAQSCVQAVPENSQFAELLARLASGL